MGDLNFPSAGCWGPAEVYEMRRQETTKGKIGSIVTQELTLLDYTESKLMVQLVKEYTRYQSILDIIFTNNTDIYRNITVEEDFTLSDHSSVLLEIEAVDLEDDDQEQYIYLTEIKNY